MDYICCDPLEEKNPNRSDGSDTGSCSTDVGVLECDYDTQVTKLYHSIEERRWEEVLYFLETGKWYNSSIFSAFGDQGDPPTIQARTWVTALDRDGNVRWCQLPLHAAVTFLAPFSVISKLVEVYPKSVRCADDQDMLPLHYAFRFGSEDEVLLSILEKFPQALSKRAIKHRLPVDLAKYGPRPERGRIIEYYIQAATRQAKHEWDREYEQEVAKMRDSAETELQRELKSKNGKLVAAKAELEATKKELQSLRRELHDNTRAPRRSIARSASIVSESSKKKRLTNVVSTSEPLDYDDMDSIAKSEHKNRLEEKTLNDTVPSGKRRIRSFFSRKK